MNTLRTLNDWYTAAQLSAVTGYGLQPPRALLRGDTNVTIYVAYKIATARGCRIEDFVPPVPVPAHKRHVVDTTKLQTALDRATATMTVAEFALSAGITLTQYHGVFDPTGRNLSAATLLKLARHFGAPVESLVTLKG